MTDDCKCDFIQKSIIGIRGTHGSYSTRHDNRKALVTLLITILCSIGMVTIVVMVSDIANDAKEPIRNNIEGYNCNQLAEYVADRSPQYEYAEHRYSWLCVNEQIKEFQ